MPSKSSSTRVFLFLLMCSVFRYQPQPISLKPRADRRLLMLAATSLLSAFSSAAGGIHGCSIWKSWGRSTVRALVNSESVANCQPKFSVSVLRCACAALMATRAVSVMQIIRFIVCWCCGYTHLRFLASCSVLLAPTSTDVTPSCRRIHRRAYSASVRPSP